MISPEMYVKIRRLFYAEHWKIGTIASELGIHWDTVRSVIESDSFNDKQIHRTRMRVTDPYVDLIRQTLDQYPRLNQSPRRR